MSGEEGLESQCSKNKVLVSTGELIRAKQGLGLVECVEKESEITQFSVIDVHAGMGAWKVF